MANDKSKSGIKSLDDLALARKQWARYEYVLSRGHRKFIEKARRCEDVYLGGGRQWTAEDRDYVENELHRPVYEVNEVKKTVDASTGYQIEHRMDMVVRPANGKADTKLAEIHTKVMKQIATQNNLAHKETKVFEDGGICGRGFYEIRVDYTDSIMGRISIEVPDYMDIIPDPDAKDYDPDKWQDVIQLRWMTLDEVEQIYGVDKRDELENSILYEGQTDFGTDDSTGPRNRFGGDTNEFGNSSNYAEHPEMQRVRVIDRQWHTYKLSTVAIFNENDIFPIDGVPPEKVAEMVDQGAHIAKRMVRKVRWTVTTENTVLHDEDSPYEHFTIVPFFYTFRRGLTAGIVENAMDLQELINKNISQYMHIINTTANSGYTVEEGTLVNMDEEQLATEGSKTGAVIVHTKGSQPPQRIQSAAVPSAFVEMINMSSSKMKEITVPDVATGAASNETSGIAIMAKQHAAQKQLAIPLDNLAQTRNLLARRIHSLVQRFMDYPTIMRITNQDPQSGKDIEEHIPLNQPHEENEDEIVNDLTSGIYHVVTTEQPASNTYGNSIFEQLVELKKAGVNIPDSAIIQASQLPNKYELSEQMSNQAAPIDPTVEAKIALIKAQTEAALAGVGLTKAQTTEAGMDTLFSALNTASVIALNPTTAPLADKLTQSVGFVDQGPPPTIPLANAPIQKAALDMAPGAAMPSDDPNSLRTHQSIGMPHNTHPNFPPNPDVGLLRGIETGPTAR